MQAWGLDGRAGCWVVALAVVLTPRLCSSVGSSTYWKQVCWFHSMQAALHLGGGVRNSSVSHLRAAARSGRERSFRNAREKIRCLPTCLLFPLGQYRSPYCFLLGFIVSTVPSVASPGPCSQPLIMGYWQLQCMSLHGTEFGHLPGLGAWDVGRPVRYTQA